MPSHGPSAGGGVRGGGHVTTWQRPERSRHKPKGWLTVPQGEKEQKLREGARVGPLDAHRDHSGRGALRDTHSGWAPQLWETGRPSPAAPKPSRSLSGTWDLDRPPTAGQACPWSPFSTQPSGPPSALAATSSCLMPTPAPPCNSGLLHPWLQPQVPRPPGSAPHVLRSPCPWSHLDTRWSCH